MLSTKIGKFNSGSDLSGDIISPHLEGVGISNKFSCIVYFGKEWKVSEEAS